MTSLREVIRKTDLALADITSSGGEVPVETETRFYRKLFEEAVLYKDARKIQMTGNTKRVPKIHFGTRFLKAANQGNIVNPAVDGTGTRALAAADRYKPTFDYVQMETKEVIGEVRVPYEFFEDNIEGENFMTTLMEELAKRSQTDLEEKLISGDTGSADAFLALHNGVLAGASSNIVNHNGAGMSVDLFKNLHKTLPVQYHKFINQYRAYISTSAEIDLRYRVAERQTSLGDAAIQSNRPITIGGLNIVGVPLMPDANALLTPPQNIMVGFQRGITLEVDKDITQRCYIFVVTMRLAHAYEEESMVVKAINIGA